jgi:acyl-homoserine lactone acylase PvdQ
MMSRSCVTAILACTLFVSQAGAQPTVGRYREFGDIGGFMNILPPGADGVLNAAELAQVQTGQYPPHVINQLGMYADLVYNTPGLTEDRLLEFFKDASFGVREDDIGRVYSPTTGVTVVRDATFGVPHIYGDTRYATMFAQGYTGAEDRLFLMDVLRHLGRARLSEFLGAAPGNVQMDRDQLAIAPYKEEDLTAQLQAIAASGPEGQAGYDDLLAYTAGVNQYINEALLDATKLPGEYLALQILLQPWKPEDTVAVASLVGGIFGKGGGGELQNACGLQRMSADLGSATEARAVFDDLHFANDPEAPTTSRDPAPYMTNLGSTNPAAHPDIDCDSLVPIESSTPSLDDLLNAIVNGPLGLNLPTAMSNALLVAGKHTRDGRPIAVFGPQTAYFMPQLLVEKDVHGPGIDARGAAFAGTDLYVQLGRGRDFAFSATSASADNVDQWVLRLCEPGGGPPTTASMGYEHDGTCVPIETWNHVQIAKPTAGGLPAIEESGAQCGNAADDDDDGFVNDGCPSVGLLPELLLQCLNATDDDADGAVNDGCLPVVNPQIVLSWRVERSADYGPIVARGTLTDGTPIAIATQRSTYQRELASAVGFRRVNDPDVMTNGFESFRAAMSQGVDYTFNWFYIDARHIGYQHSCRCPQRAAGVDPYLPAWGTGEWDWQGFLPPAEQPWDFDPAEGFITSWNNKQAPQFRANDRQFSYGPTYRSQMLDVRIKAAITGQVIDRADLVDAMEDAGTVDLRGQETLPLLLDALGTTAPPEADARAQEMRDRLAAWVATQTHRRDHDGNGAYDDPQSPAIMDAWWPRLTHAILDDVSGNAIDNLSLTIDDGDRIHHLGSAFNNGLYGHVNKDLRRLLARPQQAPWSRAYCGGGDLNACRTALWDSLSQAAADLEAEFGNPSVDSWQRAMDYEDVRHTAAGVAAVPAIHWINRPTFQQVVQVGDPPDPQKCYRAADPLRQYFTTIIGDGFGVFVGDVQRTELFCDAASVDGATVADPAAAMVCRKMKARGPSSMYPRRELLVRNAFGEQTLRLRKPTSICSPATTSADPPTATLPAYSCYRAAPRTRFTPRTVLLSDGIETVLTDIRRPNAVCLPADVDGSEVVDPGDTMVCYSIRTNRSEPRFTRQSVAATDLWRNLDLELRRPQTLCVPSFVDLP